MSRCSAVLLAGLVCFFHSAGAAACLKAEAEGQVAEGQLTRVRFTDVDYGNRVETAFILNLAEPACLEGEDAYDNVASTLKIHVFSMDKGIQRRLRGFIGRQIRVIGWSFGEHTAHHRAPIVMRVTAMNPLP